MWEDRLLPRLLDRMGQAPELDRFRDKVCRGLRGRVLEIGFGSGLNLAHYPAAVTEVLAVEPNDRAWELSAGRRAASSVPVRRAGLDGQRLPEEDASVDAVLSTLTLCTVPDVRRALQEVRRVLRPGGALHFFEHGLAPDPRVVAWQHRLDPLQGRLFGGCHLSRDIPGEVRGAGFAVDAVAAAYLPGPAAMRPWSFGYLGTATA